MDFLDIVHIIIITIIIIIIIIIIILIIAIIISNHILIIILIIIMIIINCVHRFKSELFARLKIYKSLFSLIHSLIF